MMDRAKTMLSLGVIPPMYEGAGIALGLIELNGQRTDFRESIIFPPEWRMVVEQREGVVFLIAEPKREELEAKIEADRIKALHPRDALWQNYRVRPAAPAYGHITRDAFDNLVDELEAKHAAELTAANLRINELERAQFVTKDGS